MKARWVTDRMNPVNVVMDRNTRLFAKSREGGYVLATSIYKADVMIASSRWAVSKELRARIHAEAKKRAAVAASILRNAPHGTGGSKIEVRKGASDTSVFLRDPERTDENGRQVGGAAWAVEGQTQALGTAFGTQFVRQLNGWEEMFNGSPE